MCMSMHTANHYPLSPLAFAFADYAKQEFGNLVGDIGVQGLLEPITVWRGEIIDGRHRYLACLEAGVEPRYQFLDDDVNPVLYLASKNLLRRHLDETQRAVSAYKLSALSKRGRPTNDDEKEVNLPLFLTVTESVGLLGVSESSVKHARRVLEEASPAVPELRRALEQSLVKVSDASRVVNEKPEVQRRAVEMVSTGEARTVSTAVKMISREASDSAGTDRGFDPPRCVGESIKLYHSTVTGFGLQIDQGSVDVLVVMPPREAPLQVSSDAVALAGRVLKEDGVLVVGADAERLPQLLGRLKSPDFEWVSLFYLLYPNVVVALEEPHWVSTRCLPLLVYGKPGYRLGGGEAVIEVPRTLYSGGDWLRVIDAGKECVVNRFARWGKLVCDAMLCGSSGAVVAAQDRGCTFIGADDDESRLDRVYDALTSDLGGADGLKEKMEVRQMSFE